MESTNIDGFKISIVLAIIYVFLNIFYKKILLIIIFIGVALVYSLSLFFGGVKDMKKLMDKTPIIVAFSILISFILGLLLNTPYQEEFSNGNGKKKRREKRKIM